jgi:hypothetical protein
MSFRPATHQRSAEPLNQTVRHARRRLQAVPTGTQQLPNLLRASRIAVRRQLRGKLARTFRRPAEERLRAAASTSKGIPVKVQKQLADLELDEATRPELKEIAEAIGLDTQGKKASELREMLAPHKEDKPAAAATAPAKSAAVQYPDLKTMKKEFRLFAKVNHDNIVQDIPEYFNEDEDADDPTERLHQTLADEDALKTQWKDNVWPHKKEGTWDAFVEEAQAKVSWNHGRGPPNALMRASRHDWRVGTHGLNQQPPSPRSIPPSRATGSLQSVNG